MTIKVKSKQTGVAVEFTYDIPEDLAGLTAKYGDAIVAEYAVRGITLAVQAVARQHLEEGADAVQAAVNAWQPGVRGPRVTKSPLERATAALAGMSADDLAALLAKVKAATGAKK